MAQTRPGRPETHISMRVRRNDPRAELFCYAQQMGDDINLNQWNKKKARAEKQKRSEQNRLKAGQSAAELSLRKKKKELEAKRLDGHKLDRDEDG